MTSLRFTEEMKGHVTFGEKDYNQGYWIGRRDGTDLRFRLDIETEDVDAFIADPEHEASATGWIECQRLGGRMTVERGRFNLFVVSAGARRSRMQYRLFATDADGRKVTLSGFKVLEDDPHFDLWSDTTTLRTRLLSGHVEAADERDREPSLLASGMLTIGYAGFMKLLTTVRAEGGSRRARARAVTAFTRLFLGELERVYRGATPNDTEPNFPHPTPHEGYGRNGYAPGEWHDLRRGLRRRIVPFAAGDGYPCNLHNIRGGQEPTLGPLLVNAGTGVRANIFYDAPLPTSIVDALVAEGYDVWIENWRASIDFPRRDYTLDQAALFDHPAAVRTILHETGAEKLKALVHCQGSTGFFLSLCAGLLPQVTTVVSNAVSTHPVVSGRSRMKLRFMRPVTAAFVSYADPQWAIRAQGPKSAIFGSWVRMIRRECDNRACGLTSYMYGVGPDVLWLHENLTPETHDWVGGEFSWVPMTFFDQIWKSVKEGALVSVEGYGELPSNVLAQDPPTDARITFMAGADNKCFDPESQRRAFAWWDEKQPGRHAHVELPGYSHLDVFYGRNAARDTYPQILAGLAR